MMRKTLYCWSIITLLITVTVGGWAALAMMTSVYIITFRRHKDLFFYILVGLPFFGNSPGRPFVYLLNGVFAIIVLHWLSSQRKQSVSEKTGTFFLKVGFVWVILSLLQLVPMIWTIVVHASLNDILTIMREAFFLDETSHLFPIQAVYNRCWVLCMAFYFLAVITKDDFPRLLLSLMTGLALTVTLGLLEYFHIFPVYFSFLKHGYGTIPRLQSFFGNPGWLAEYLCLMVPLLLFLLLARSVAVKQKRVLAVLGLWTGVTLYLSYARAGWVCGVMILIVVGAFALAHLAQSRWRVKPLFTLSAVVIILSIFVVLVAGNVLFESDFINKEIQFGSTFSRYELWHAAVELLKRHPLIGNGPGTFWYRSPEYIPPDSYLSLVQHNTAHNTILHLLAEEGLLGFLLFMVLLLRSGLAFQRNDVTVYGPAWSFRACLVALWIVVVVYGIFQHLFYIHVIEILVWLILALPDHEVLNRSDNGLVSSPVKSKGLNLFLGAIVFLFLIMLVLRGNGYLVSYGFHKFEGWDTKLEAHFRWSKANTGIILPALKGEKSMLCIPFRATNPDLAGNPLGLEIFNNGKQITDCDIKSSEPDFLLFHLRESESSFSIDIRCARSWRPVDFGMGNDFRELGLATGPFALLGWKQFISRPIDGNRTIHTAAGSLVQPLTDFTMTQHEQFVFPAYAGLRLLLAEMKNSSARPIFLELTAPSGLVDRTSLEPGLNKVILKIAPTTGETSIQFRLMDRNGSQDVNVTARFIEWKILPWQELKHFAFQ